MTDQELNEAVARKLGWQYSKREDGYDWYGGKLQTYHTRIPDYCHSIEAAWEIVEKFKIIDDRYTFFLSFQEDTLKWEAVWNESVADELVRKEADTAPKAICLAFLKLPGGQK